jgi:large subunit ribosomal protein L4e
MFSPNKTWRRWHRKVNVTQRRYAVTSALAASAVPALVMARGHRIEQVAEVPLVVNDDIQSVQKTQKALEIMSTIGANDDLEKVKASSAIRRGAGKGRNRRYVQRRGPLVIYNEDNGLVKALRNIPGVDTCCVTRLNLLQLAPGGHLGRFCIWTKSAFERLDSLYGTPAKLSAEKTGYHMPRPTMSQADLTRILTSDEVKSVLRAKRAPAKIQRKKNALKNLGVMHKLNPYHKAQLRAQLTGKKVAKATLSAEKKKAIAKNQKQTRARVLQ